MELAERLRKIMEQEFNITSDVQLIEAISKMDELDIGIFLSPIKGEKNANPK